MTLRSQILELAAEGMRLHKETAPEYKICAAVLEMNEEIKCEERRFNELWEQYSALDKLYQELVEALNQFATIHIWEGNCKSLSEARQRVRHMALKSLEKSGWFADSYFKNLAEKMEPLGDEFQKVLNDNLWDLYESGDDK